MEIQRCGPLHLQEIALQIRISSGTSNWAARDAYLVADVPMPAGIRENKIDVAVEWKSDETDGQHRARIVGQLRHLQATGAAAAPLCHEPWGSRWGRARNLIASG